MSERIDITRQLFDEMLQRKWAEGYDAGNGMMLKAIATAELLEQKRIVKILEEARRVYKPNTVSYDYVTGLIEVITGQR